MISLLPLTTSDCYQDERKELLNLLPDLIRLILNLIKILGVGVQQ